MAVAEPVSADVAVSTRFRDVVASMPDTDALVSASVRYTYRDLDRWSDAIAVDLQAVGAPKDRPVAVVTRDSVIVVPAALGILKAGHYFAVIDGTDPNERIAVLLETAGAEVCVVDSPVTDAIAGKRILRVTREWGEITPTLETPNELVQVMFTSGTTGTPKGVVWKQRGYAERLVRSAARTGRAFGERVSYTALPGHARAASEIFGALLNGATLCAFDPRSEPLDALANLIERERISILTLTPALFRRFMRALPEKTDLSSVRKLRLGADVVTVADVDAWRARFPANSTLERAYASTETGRVMHMSITHDTPVSGPLVPMGRPLPGVDVAVIDDDGNDVAAGQIGELVVRSSDVVHGYWNAPELTDGRFTFDEKHPERATFRTGDLVRFDDDGLYYFVGRRDDRLKVHGRRIDPIEVESALMLHGGAREALVVAETGPDGEARLAAWIVANTRDPREIRASMRGHVPDWMIPTHIYLTDTLPTTRTGKVDRNAASIQPTGQVDVDTPSSGAPDNVEQAVFDIWSRVLGRTVEIEIDDDFFEDLGGGSLDALEIVAETKRVTGRSLPLSLLLELNTVRKMSGYLSAQPDKDRTVIALRRQGSHPPLFCVSGKGGSVIVFRALAKALGDAQPFFGLTHHGIDPDHLPSTLAAIAACYVDAIRAEYPEGPYYVAGYSAGGFIAWEIARQLSRAGDQVAFVGLFDTTASRARVSIWRRYAKYVSIFRRRPVSSAARFMRALGRRVLWALRWVISTGKESFVPELEANRFYDSLDMHASLQPYSGPVTVFRARHGGGHDCPLTDSGWGSLCQGELTVREVEGEHETILTTDVDGLARELSIALENARTA